jgi:hypothetical protein
MPAKQSAEFVIEKTSGELVKSGILTGTVKDLSGALIVSSEIRLRESLTNAERVVQVDEIGTFSFSGLTDGKYEMTVTAVAFKQFKITELELKSSEGYRAEIFMEPGRPTEENFIREVEIESTRGMIITELFTIKKVPIKN